MVLTRLLSLIAFAALMLAPFGRMAAAEPAAMPHHGAQMAVMAGHCADGDGGDQSNGSQAIDCMTACAMVAAGDVSHDAPRHVHADAPAASVQPFFIGTPPEADPPPPRFS